MKISKLSEYLQRLERTSSRIEMTNVLTELLKVSDAKEIDKIVYLSLGILAPNYESIILNLAEKMVIRVLAIAYNIDSKEVLRMYKEKGDLGDTAQSLSKNKNTSLTVDDVYKKLVEIANESGAGSQDKKIEKTASLLKELDSLSVRFVSRIPVGRLRLGFSEKTVTDALSKATGIDSGEIEKAYNIRPDIGYVSKLAKEGKIEKAKPEIGIPVVPMLAQRLNSPAEMVKKMGEVSVEPKFDGLRIFIHYRKKDNFLRIFTRNMNAIDIATFPELSKVGESIKADEVILDTEAVGVDPKRQMFLDFQKTIQRRRKHDVEKNALDIPLQFQVFDILLLNGKSFIESSYLERRKEIEKVIVNGGLLRVDENTITKDPEVIRKLHLKYLGMGLEGVVVKKTGGNYVSGRTGWNWVKMKEEEGKSGKLSDTVDIVVMGYTTGKGKRVGFGIGQFLAGIKDGDKFKTVTKVGTGLTDEQFRELNQRLSKFKTEKMPKEYEVHKDLTPDFWVLPNLVIEIAADEITKSPKHTSGLALRFPRLINFRDDKSSNEVTTLKELQEMFKMQKPS